MILLLFLLLLQLFPSSHTSTEKYLLDHLLSNYSSYPRPVKNVKDPIIVTFGFNLIQITNIIERDQYITTKLWMRMKWKNELLNWNPRDWDNITVTRLPQKLLWTPDIYLQEDVGADISSGPSKYKTPIVVQSDGTCTWLIPVKVQSTCSIDVRYFPFDRQVCTFVFSSWTHDQTEIDIRAEGKPVVDGTFMNSTEWRLLDVERRVVSNKYACCPNPFVDIQFQLKLQRIATYYIYHVVIPCVVQMMIILFTFFLPPESGERIGVVITVLLVFAVYLQILSESLPQSSLNTPALSHFYITAMVESACSLIATCLVLAIHFRGTKKGVAPMKPWMRKYLLYYLGGMVGFSTFRKWGIEKDSPMMRLSRCEMGLDDANENDLGYQNRNDLTHQTKNDLGYPADQMDGKIVGSLGRIRNGSLSSHGGGVNYVNGFHRVGGFLENRQMEREMKVITQHVKNLHEGDRIAEEWELLSSIIDRMFFVIFLIIFFTSSVYILLPAYMINHY